MEEGLFSKYKDNNNKLTNQTNGSVVNHNGSISLNGNVVRKQLVNISKQTEDLSPEERKKYARAELRKCDYRTPPFVIETYLKIMFYRPDTKKGHLLWIAQHFNPRAINRVIDQITREMLRGDKTITNPTRYFTFLIKNRQPRSVYKKKKEKQV